MNFMPMKWHCLKQAEDFICVDLFEEKMYEFKQIQIPKETWTYPQKYCMEFMILRDGQIAVPTYQDCLRHRQSQ